MVIESLGLYYHIECFRCCVCNIPLSSSLEGTDVRVRNNRLHCQNCFSDENGKKNFLHSYLRYCQSLGAWISHVRRRICFLFFCSSSHFGVRYFYLLNNFNALAYNH